MHIFQIKVGDCIYNKDYNYCYDDRIVFHWKKLYQIKKVERCGNIFYLCIDSEIGDFDMVFDLDRTQRRLRFGFTPASELRIQKIKTFLTE